MALKCGVNTGMRNGACEIAGKYRSLDSAHQRCSIHQYSAQAVAHSMMVPTVTANTSPASRTLEVGCLSRGNAHTSASRPAKGTISAGMSHVTAASSRV